MCQMGNLKENWKTQQHRTDMHIAYQSLWDSGKKEILKPNAHIRKEEWMQISVFSFHCKLGKEEQINSKARIRKQNNKD